MFARDLEQCHFLIYCKQNPNESILILVSKNKTLIENMLGRSEKYFHKILLPKIVSWKLDYTNDNVRKR